MHWVYCPISIRTHLNDEVHSTSGVQLQLLQDAVVKEEFNLSISAIPKQVLDSNVTKTRFYISNDTLISEDEVKWYETTLDFAIDPVSSIPELQKFLQFFKSSGFSLLPQDYVSSSNLAMSVVNLKPISTIPTENLSPIRFTTSHQYTPIQIIGFPFSFTNPALFSNFRLNGSINYINQFGYLTDIKYVDNLLGAVTNSTSQNNLKLTESLGLVATNLKKFNGDGDLMFILSWRIIWTLISSHFRSNSSWSNHHPVVNKLSNVMTINQESVSDTNLSVVPILITSPVKQTWGSCVILDSEYLITNFHVLHAPGDKVIYLTEAISLDVTNDTMINFEDIDLCFVKLSLGNQFKLKSCSNFQPIGYSTDYSVNDTVSTIGYGLFFDTSQISPIRSHGHILAKRNLRFHNESRVPSLVITSAGCWNGSSGGGLFKDEKLIGLICSNAQINVLDVNTNEEIHEKLSKFCFILPIEIILICFECVKTSQDVSIHNEFKQWWNLSTTHYNRYIDIPNPKL